MTDRQHEAESQLHDLIERHQYEYVNYLVNACNAEYNFYSQVYTRLYDLDTYYNQLRQHAQNVSIGVVVVIKRFCMTDCLLF
jgi:murein tripeptide amidase MpaA